MVLAERAPSPRNRLIGLVALCIAVFTVGIVLLIVGFFKYTTPYPSVPYFWSVGLCRVNETEKWVGMELHNQHECPRDPPPEPQEISIPAGILVASVPYDPVIYVTNKGMFFFRFYC